MEEHPRKDVFALDTTETAVIPGRRLKHQDEERFGRS